MGTAAQAAKTARFQKRRRAILRAARRKKPIDAFLATDTADIRYLCGLIEGSSSVLFADDWCVVMTRRMFATVAAEQCLGAEVVVTDDPDRRKPPRDDREIARQLRKRRARRLGFDESLVSVARYKSLTEQVSEKRLVPCSGLIVNVRAIKDDEEIALTRKTIRIAEKAFRRLTERGADYFIRKTERHLATELEYLMRGLGADRQAFQFNGIIVASGPHSASCHHVPTDRRIRSGDVVLFDWGAERDGYRSDITRVVFVRSVPDAIGTIYPIVERAYRQAIEAIRPGVRNHTIDAAARNLIEDAGYGDEFRHGLGHGIGLEIHEQPRLTTGPATPLKKNMIVTIEPGIYLDGIGGVRLEDDILVTADSHENLCHLPTSLSHAIVS